MESWPSVQVCETLEEEFEAAERGAAETVDGLIVVAHDNDVAGIVTEEVKQFELGDVGVLKFIDQDVFVAFAELTKALRIAFQEGDGFGDGTIDGDGTFIAQDFLAGAVGAGDFLLERYVFGTLLVSVVIESRFSAWSSAAS